MQHPTSEAPSREPAENESPGRPPSDVALENIVRMTGLGRYDDVRQLLADVHPADIAELLDRLAEPRVRQRVFGLLPLETASAVLSLHLERLGAELSRLTESQADYLGISRDGPFKPAAYRY